MGYPTSVDLNRLSPIQIDFAMQEFMRSEAIRNRLSISHKEAIETTNMGYDWYERCHSTGDF